MTLSSEDNFKMPGTNIFFLTISLGDTDEKFSKNLTPAHKPLLHFNLRLRAKIFTYPS